MVWSNVRIGAVLEVVVVLFQVAGLLGLVVSRLAARSRWADQGRRAFVVSMIGLGVAGAVCGRYDSEFALFAGGTMTFLLVGMTVGSGHTDMSMTNRGPGVAEAAAAG